MIRNNLEYCCKVWNPWNISDIQAIENIQRSFTRKISGLSEKNYYERVKILNIMSLQRRREMLIILHMFKILHSMVPNDLKISFHFQSRRGIRAITPSLKKKASKKSQSRYDSSFVVVGTKLWNTLPKSLTDICNLSQFKTNLKLHLKSVPDEPPIIGYYYQNDNSLINQTTYSIL